ncbi:regulatory protein RecX [Ohtaekwangia koreensis]|uniref:Regulatory protein RecX n=1 Tax=Ohtaekwangia koreensis TaxID=688867 RepID=A0A1T5LKY5_9BACT|nr:RecX family transcriptional regulator [Ohtaekwangia koreensis]SKC76148.1 regulatory protein [Ohtaekwangia koreensis]
MQPKRLSPSEAKQKIYRYCAYQERSHKEVRDKLYEYGLYKSDVEDILSTLITDGFLNEERFAKAFAGGKFRMQHWGRLKIVNELEGKGLTKNCIKIGMKEIEDDAYIQTLREILQKKSRQLEEKNPFIKRDKVARYAIQKGFEPELVWTHVKELVKD